MTITSTVTGHPFIRSSVGGNEGTGVIINDSNGILNPGVPHGVFLSLITGKRSLLSPEDYKGEW